MTNTFAKWGTLGVTALATLAFLGAGSFKLSGAEEMIQMFGRYGFPVWFMYFIGACEISGAVGLWLPMTPVGPWALKRLAALGLAIVMAGAVVMHVLHDPISKGVPALVLLVITAYLTYAFGKTAGREVSTDGV